MEDHVGAGARGGTVSTETECRTENCVCKLLYGFYINLAVFPGIDPIILWRLDSKDPVS